MNYYSYFLPPLVSPAVQVLGFDWTSPRQVAVAEATRRGRPTTVESLGTGGRGDNSVGGSATRGTTTVGSAEQKQHGAGIGLDTIPCRNLANQILYLSVEATSPRVRFSCSGELHKGRGARISINDRIDVFVSFLCWFDSFQPINLSKLYVQSRVSSLLDFATLEVARGVFI